MWFDLAYREWQGRSLSTPLDISSAIPKKVSLGFPLGPSNPGQHVHPWAGRPSVPCSHGYQGAALARIPADIGIADIGIARLGGELLPLAG
jgi:hypothetical protein